jgi:hypothetical protein
MAETVNLRTARKQAKRRRDDELARAHRVAHGEPKNVRRLRAAQQELAAHILDAHRLGPGDGK